MHTCPLWDVGCTSNKNFPGVQREFLCSSKVQCVQCEGKGYQNAITNQLTDVVSRNINFHSRFDNGLIFSEQIKEVDELLPTAAGPSVGVAKEKRRGRRAM